MKNLFTTALLVGFIIFLYSFSKGERELANNIEIKKEQIIEQIKVEAVTTEVIILESVDKDITTIESVESVDKDITLGMVKYMDAIGMQESSDNYDTINKYGYKGRYQFGGSALKDLKIHNRKDFLKNEELQDNAFISLCRINKYRLRKFINKYEGSVINGIKITESGILASAHLVGAKSVKEYLKSNGNKIRKDANGTSVEKYMKKFAGYELNITAKRKINLKNF
ncbi:peptidoglycan-binding [Tenacibaculum phage pT24]|uniref:Peptidoglycan-binding n=1 Tax=Tenacibaculum phage pT24 TaxID=1880590 RepID=A0A1B4XX13_9CAUD|nr:baseplate hub subunit and tail lysozyme [Tenacibaculum phage pT24]BAV39344.1 peptidoglycan-binding [Tenacibaculum phage pT24]